MGNSSTYPRTSSKRHEPVLRLRRQLFMSRLDVPLREEFSGAWPDLWVTMEAVHLAPDIGTSRYSAMHQPAFSIYNMEQTTQETQKHTVIGSTETPVLVAICRGCFSSTHTIPSSSLISSFALAPLITLSTTGYSLMASSKMALM